LVARGRMLRDHSVVLGFGGASAPVVGAWAAVVRAWQLGAAV